MLRNCRECEQVFSHPVNKLCPNCLEQRSEDYDTVRQYLKAHPGVSVGKTSADTGVSLERIQEFIAEGRLAVNPSDSSPRCRICGSRVERGRICRSCQQEMNPGPQPDTAKTKPKQSSKSRVHLIEQLQRHREGKK